jgi:PAS domain S-box-containing protein
MFAIVNLRRNRTYRLILLTLNLLLLTFGIKAQEFNFANITLRDGLPSSQVNCIYQDEEGYIWIGTNEGIKKYAGKSFIDIYAANPVSLSRPITSIAESEHNVWFSNNRSLFKCIGNYTEEYPLFSKTNSVFINKVVPVSDSVVYMLTNAGVWQFKDNKFSQVYTNLKIDVENITCGYYRKNENELWLGTDGSGIYAISTLNDSLINTHQRIYDELKNEKIKDIESYFDSKIFISVTGRGIMQYNFKTPVWLEGNKADWLAYTSDIHTDKKGNIWFATFGSGLVKYNEKDFEIITEENGLPENNLLCATTDNYGNVWCGTASLGVSILLNETFLLYNTKQNLPAANCRQIIPLTNNQWLLCTSGGACFFDGKNVSPFYEQKTENIVCADFNAFTNQIALAHSYSTIDIYDCTTKKSINQLKTNAQILSVKFLSDSALLIGTQKQGLLIYSFKTKLLEGFSSQLNSLSINCIAVDKGIIWAGTNKGLFYSKGNETSKLTDKDNQLSESAVYSISYSDNYIFAATNGYGLFKYNKNSKTLDQIERKQGLRSLVIKAVSAINDNEVYISSSNSLYRILFESNEIKIRTLVEGFSRNNAEFLPGSLMSGISSNFYLGTSRGLLVYKQSESGDVLKGLTVKLTAVQLFNDTTNWQRMGYHFNSKANMPEELLLHYNKNDLTFYFEVFNSLGDNKYYLKYKLEGFDKKWIYTDKTNHAIYSDLTDGKYTFFVSVSFDGTNWSAPADFPFTIEPPFWKTNAFLALILAVLISIIAFLLRFFKSYKDDLIKSSDVEYNLPNTRIILACGAVLIPVNAFVYAAINDNYDAKLLYQIASGVIMLFLMMFTYTSRFVKVNGKGLLLVSIYLLTALYILLSYLSNLTPYFFVGLVIIINIAHLVISKIKPFIIYATFVTLAAVVLVLIIKNPVYSSGLFFMAILSSLILTLISIQVQLNLYDRLFFADTTINTGNSLVIASNKDGDIIFASKNFEQILGYTEVELLGNGWWQIRSEDPKYNQKVKESVVAKNMDRNSVERIVDKKGVPRWIQWENSYFENNLVVGIGIDITDKKEIEERYQHIVESASDIIYTTNVDGFFTYVNEVTARVTEFTNEELLLMRFNKLVRKDYVKETSLFYLKQVAEQAEESYIEIPIITKSGKEIWVGQSSKLSHDENDDSKVTGFQVICRDVTERREAQKQIEEKNKRIQQYSEKLELLNDVKQIILEATEKNDLIERVLTQLTTKITDAKRATLTLFDDKIHTAYLYEYKPIEHKIDLTVLPALDYRSLPNLLKNQYFKVDDFFNSGEFSKSDSLMKELGINSYLITPLFYSGKLTGSFSLASEHKNLFDEDYINFARQIADAIAITLEQISYRKELSEKNKDISDNIEYSHRIQQSVMPPESFMQAFIPESFIILKQRDVIGGDFYWCDKKGDKIFIALGDCTGHGVSGALLSILCSNIISQAIKEYNMFDPGLILDFLNRRIKESLNQYKQADEILDGLDVSICVLDLKYKVLMFSGAMQNLYITNNGHLNEVKGNRMPIGGIASGLKTQFTTQIRLLNEDLNIYMSSDGFFDQFKGTEIKKYSKSRFKFTLLDIEHLPLQKQKEYLWKQHTDWKENGNQTDDICMIGFSLKGVLNNKQVAAT